jgi:DNA-binding GntR family transcriptional regulator
VAITIAVDKKKKSLREPIARLIQESILQGELRPGEQLIEAALAKRMNVSRAPLREAFWFLERQGYVRIVPHQGTYVVDLAPVDIKEICLLRDALEPMVANIAAKHLGSDDKHELAALLSTMRECVGRHDRRRYYENELRFHQKIWNLSGNRRMEEVLNAVCAPLFTFRILKSEPSKGVLTQSLKTHEALFKAIQSQDAQLEAFVRASLRCGRTSILSHK